MFSCLAASAWLQVVPTQTKKSWSRYQLMAYFTLRLQHLLFKGVNIKELGMHTIGNSRFPCDLYWAQLCVRIDRST